MSSATLPRRYIPHSNTPPTDIKPVKHRIHEALAENVLRVHRHPSTSPKVYHGSAGEIIMDMRTFGILPSKNFPNTATSSLIADPFHEPRDGSHVAYLETSVGPATLVLVRQLRLRQSPESTANKHARRGKLDGELLDEVELSETWRGAIDLLHSAQEVAVSEALDDDGCEVLYGRAGLLYALLVLKSELAVTLSYLEQTRKTKDKIVRDVEKLCSHENLKELVDDIIKRGEFGAQRYAEELEESEKANAPPLIWKWHEARYLGAAHGVVGILHPILYAPSDIIKPHWDKILATVQWLLAVQDPLGNWPTKAGRHMPVIPGGSATHAESKHVAIDEEHDDSLVQWCHGASGFLMFFSVLLRRASLSPSACPLPPSLRESIVAAVTRAGELVYTRGLLRKGVGLCHGVGGSVYALLAVSDALDSFSSPNGPSSRHANGASPHSHGFSGLARSMTRSPPLPADLDEQHAHWFRSALHLADLATGWRVLMQEGKMEIPEHAYSLYGGVAGMVCAWAEVYTRLTGHAKEGIAHGNGHVPGDAGAGAGAGEAHSHVHAPQRRGGMPGFDDLAMFE
ncbi:hypothetical protein BD311DRAFT_824624 [Dichomitus squalens]|uniref:Lanthionine synthetase C family protein n=1 Tax=Dichomitus squalens TaxID=114155 RepID=A0A4Q9M861_9APHY|nr:hypothetical protein BD311DRAFT_824624 [Dichomitus squalens]